MCLKLNSATSHSNMRCLLRPHERIWGTAASAVTQGWMFPCWHLAHWSVCDIGVCAHSHSGLSLPFVCLRLPPLCCDLDLKCAQSSHVCGGDRVTGHSVTVDSSTESSVAGCAP